MSFYDLHGEAVGTYRLRDRVVKCQNRDKVLLIQDIVQYVDFTKHKPTEFSF